MEDMARLAFLEHSINDLEIFYKLLQELLIFINQILENPHENEFRQMKSNILGVYTCEAFTDYLKYIGLRLTQSCYIYPKEETLSRLRLSQVAIERKLNLCTGPTKDNKIASLGGTKSIKRLQLSPCFIQIKLHPMLIEMRRRFNDMLKYEDDNLLDMAREQIPLVTLQSMALEKMREQQKKIQTGVNRDPIVSFDVALLMELMGWFKFKYFSWVDKPPCEKCGEPTVYISTAQLAGEADACNIETYKCPRCLIGTNFPRYNNPATLMRTRRGRCGEWANCFTLFCRALGYDTRFVTDDQDHVWCEVFDYDNNTWLHVDPCEAAINTPLMYCYGWKKKLSYVFAYSRDDLQDVTWRYTMDHKEVRKRRTAVSEAELLRTMVSLRAHRHAQLPPARRRYLAARTLHELADLMRERKPTDYESRGRISGSREWRERRGEARRGGGHTFEFRKVGTHLVRYCTSLDVYRVYTNGVEVEPVRGWRGGVHECEYVFRKVEGDWRRVYLAREEGELIGNISWSFACKGNDVIFNSLGIKLVSHVFECGLIEWTIQFDNEAILPVEFGESVSIFSREFKSFVLRAKLTGGRGEVGWQHAQLFRAALDATEYTFEVQLQLGNKFYL